MSTTGIGKVWQAVREVIREVQAAGGHETPTLDPGLCPIGGIEGFDSLISVEATVMLEQRLGVKLPNDTMFVESGQAATLEQVVTRIADACGAMG